MVTEVGEYLVGAYLKLCLGCDFVDYNVRPPGGGLEGLEELDVLGLNFDQDAAYLCEVTTHIGGLLYVSNTETIARIKKKHRRQKQYARKYLCKFGHVHYMFWSPVVPKGALTRGLATIRGLEVVINGDYKQRVDELRDLARETTHDTKNPVFRTLQILEHLRS